MRLLVISYLVRPVYTIACPHGFELLLIQQSCRGNRTKAVVERSKRVDHVTREQDEKALYNRSGEATKQVNLVRQEIGRKERLSMTQEHEQWQMVAATAMAR